jgi:hypothetical protein
MIASRYLRGFLWVVVVIGFGLLNGCGGDDDDDIPGECVSACNTGCSRAASCQFISGSDLNACSDACVDNLRGDAQLTPQGCQNAAVAFAGASCSQLADILGLRSVDSAPRAEGRGDEAPSLFTTVLQGIIKALTPGK